MGGLAANQAPSRFRPSDRAGAGHPARHYPGGGSPWHPDSAAPTPPAQACPLGQILGTKSFPATAAGYGRLLAWARKLGTVRRAGVEGTGSFGAGLSRYLPAQRVQVFELNRPGRSALRLLGKSDPLDAQAAARAVLSGRARARAKSGDGPVQSAWMFKIAQDSAVKARTQAINQLKAVLVVADPALRERLSGLGNRELSRS
ncbi:transposase [Streptomyces sp. NPDC048277]|uniref:IS110 family transposase n=1 Tax=Streptomyces sp. NPDC048277 TaxID=3155027 RepID=UPI00340664C9